MKLRVSFCFSPDEKIPVGTLMDSGRDVAFEYDRGFAATGLQPAPFRLPVRVAGEGADPKEDDLRRLAESVGIADEVAREEYAKIVDVCGDLLRFG